MALGQQTVHCTESVKIRVKMRVKIRTDLDNMLHDLIPELHLCNLSIVLGRQHYCVYSHRSDVSVIIEILYCNLEYIGFIFLSYSSPSQSVKITVKLDALILWRLKDMCVVLRYMFRVMDFARLTLCNFRAIGRRNVKEANKSTQYVFYSL